MAIWGEESIDLRAILAMAADGAPPGDLTAPRLRQLNEALRRVRGRAVLYVASGSYTVVRTLLRYAAWEGDLVIPPNVTVWMEDKAEFVVEGRLVLLGGLVASRTRIFREVHAGMVLLGGDLEAIYPEWWGAEGGGDDDFDDRNQDALQRALDTGSARRQPVVETLQSNGAVATDFSDARRSIPVLLSARYAVRRPLWMGRPMIDGGTSTPQQAGVGQRTVRTFGSPGSVATTLRGVATGRATPTCGLIAQARGFVAESSELSSLLILQHAFGAVVENVVLDASRSANYAIIVRPTLERPTMRSVAVRRCHVLGARRAQIQIGPPSPDSARDKFLDLPADPKPGTTSSVGIIRVPAERSPFAGGDVHGLSIEDNLIECSPPLSDEGGLDSELSVGIQMRAGNGVAVHVTRNVFRGCAKTFVDARAIMALIEQCDFANLYASSREFLRRGSLGFEEADGEDIYLSYDRWVYTPSGGSPNRVEGAVAVTHCISYSAQFFGTPQPGPLQNKRSERASLILHVCHTPQPWLPRSVELRGTPSYQIPSVYWGRFSPSLPRIVQGDPIARGLNPDPALSVVGSLLNRGMAVGTGAAQSVVVSCWMPNRTMEPRFVQTRQGITRPTVVFGILSPMAAFMLLLLLLMGCTNGSTSAPPPSDAASNDLAEAVDRANPPTDAAAPVDATAHIDATPTRDIPRDLLSDAPVDRWWFTRDVVIPSVADVRDYDLSVTPRQASRSCPAPNEGDPAIAPPRLIFPLSTQRVTSRRPTLLWELAPGTTGARVEICRDPCCATPITAYDVEGTQGRPPEPLPPGVVFWRMRGRSGTTLGRTTSFTWEFSVRRRDLPSDTAAGTLRDYNGDGYDDVATISFNTMIVFWGGPDGLSAERRQEVPLPDYYSVIAAGDVNGDGYGDVVGSSSAWTQEAPSTYLGRTWIAYGSRGGVQIRDAPILTGQNSRIGVVDLNGDGFSDCVSVAPNAADDELFALDILFGSEQGFGGARQRIRSPNRPMLHGYLPPLAAPGDLDGDGYGDLLATDPEGGGGVGAVYVYRGRSGSLSPLPDRTITPQREGLFGMPGFGTTMSSLGDLNGDRREDVLIWESRRDATNVYLGHRDDLLRHAQRLLWDGPYTERNRRGFGNTGPTAPDLDLDGRPELVVGCQACVGDSDRQFELGRAFIYRGSPGEYGAPTFLLRPLPGTIRGHFPAAMTVMDLNGDGADDLVLGDPEDLDVRPYRGRIDYYFGGSEPTRRSVFVEQPGGLTDAIGYIIAFLIDPTSSEVTHG